MMAIREAGTEDAVAIAALRPSLATPPRRLRFRAAWPGALGSALVEAAARHAAIWGCTTLELTSRDDGQAAHRLYSGLGFESSSRKFVRRVAG
jgi:GNAT superfamily N-acetyltransferase